MYSRERKLSCLYTIAAMISFGAIGGYGCNSSCEEGGREYADGESWMCSDDCNTCSCEDGQVTSTRKFCGETR